MNTWNLRTLFNPVIARILINGTNPFDLESVLADIDAISLHHVRQLETLWFEKWSNKASHYCRLAEEAESRREAITAKTFYTYAASCFFACFLINFSDIKDKKKAYGACAKLYAKSVEWENAIVKTLIPLATGVSLCTYVVAPPSAVPLIAAVAFFSGLGSCKEEMLGIARTFAERGILVVVPDMPGNGETLLQNAVCCSRQLLMESYKAIADFCEIKTEGRIPIGVGGLCMGGGYALNAASIDKRYTFCTALFPLFINETAEGVTPRWMTSGNWLAYQIGGVSAEVFRAEMGFEATTGIDCPLFLAHGIHDNWMKFDKIRTIFEGVRNERKKLLIVDDAPVYARTDEVIHAMPVGEQLHWVKHLMADWVYELVMQQ